MEKDYVTKFTGIQPFTTFPEAPYKAGMVNEPKSRIK